MSDRAWKTMAVFDDYDDEIKRLRAEVERLRAENKRLRAGLLAELDWLEADEHTAALDGVFYHGWNGALSEVRRWAGDDQ